MNRGPHLHFQSSLDINLSKFSQNLEFNRKEI